MSDKTLLKRAMDRCNDQRAVASEHSEEALRLNAMLERMGVEDGDEAASLIEMLFYEAVSYHTDKGEFVIGGPELAITALWKGLTHGIMLGRAMEAIEREEAEARSSNR